MDVENWIWAFHWDIECPHKFVGHAKFYDLVGYVLFISRSDCVISIFKQLLNTYYFFDILETSVLTKLNEWYRLQCTSWVRILFENHVFSISLHASFPFFRAVSQCINCIFSCINCVLSSIPYNFALNGIRQSVKWTFAE